ncbi:MAG TPA: NifU family protein [Ruminococcaceae bacterium]|nr:NifU family protein [Oscillospiraceae bacterium]
MKDYIADVIRPKIQGDGGEVSLLKQEGNEITLVFQGECSKCLILDRCVNWIKSEIKKDLNMDVKIIPVRKKPYFWDT